MAMPTFTMRQLLEAGVHFGHHTRRWNPKMGPYIFGVRNGVHIIDLGQSVPLLQQGIEAIRSVAASGGRVLFVGTKRQASDKIAETAKRCGQYYVNHRWLGGMLSNWKTISNSIKHLRTLDEQLAKEGMGLTKREMLSISREKTKLDKALGGIKDMGGTPDLLVVIDTNKEAIAIQEARKLGIPIVAIVDTNCDPDGIDYPVPGNDDAGRAITLYCDLMARAALDGIERAQGSSGIDVGASESPPAEDLPKVTFKGIEAPRGEADDLKRIIGIAPKLEQRLNDAGVYHFWQIADLDADYVAALDRQLKLKGQIAKEDWVGQAKKLVEAAAV